MSRMKRFLYASAAVSLVLMFISFIVMKTTYRSIFMVLGIIFMTLCFHISVRLVLGSLIGGTPLERIKPNERRFRELKLERGLYRLLRVKKWKKRLPFYDKALYSLKEHTPDELVRIVCRSETVHWYCAAASMLTVLLAIPLGSLPAFLITGVLGALWDLMFVAVQRYNRPRLQDTAIKMVIAGKGIAEEAAEETAEE